MHGGYIRRWGSMDGQCRHFLTEAMRHSDTRTLINRCAAWRKDQKIKIIAAARNKKMMLCNASAACYLLWLKIRVRDEGFRSCQLRTVDSKSWWTHASELVLSLFFFLLLFSASRPRRKKKNSNCLTMQTMRRWRRRWRRRWLGHNIVSTLPSRHC